MGLARFLQHEHNRKPIMETTVFLSRIIGPVLLLRGLSILVDRRHFAAMLEGLEREASTVSFSLVPVALLMAGLAIVALHADAASPAAVLIHLIAWGGILKASALILFLRAVVAKARVLGRAGFLSVVSVVCLLIGGYLCWFGYLGPRP